MMTTRWMRFGMVFLLAACGGTVVERSDGDEGGSSGSAGSGGTVSGGSGGEAFGGSGGMTGGSGGAITGGSGGGMTGGSGSSECPPMPSCNWCGGETVFDPTGCPAGYVCANGIDPCMTEPCFGPEDCADGETCGEDMLCWPGSLTCWEGGCGGGVGPDGKQTCDCSWACSDGNNYGFHCEANPTSLSCDCFQNGQLVFGCGSGGGGSPPSVCSDCCGFPR